MWQGTAQPLSLAKVGVDDVEKNYKPDHAEAKGPELVVVQLEELGGGVRERFARGTRHDENVAEDDDCRRQLNTRSHTFAKDDPSKKHIRHELNGCDGG